MCQSFFEIDLCYNYLNIMIILFSSGMYVVACLGIWLEWFWCKRNQVFTKIVKWRRYGENL
ncbi:hypothetical protein VIBNIAM115_480073 [Vibrio nigripulchritudo AM115]|nr:hypothetical protein VIBNIAM115_480073 [Vibrio nigripulchritudo AM115]